MPTPIPMPDPALNVLERALWYCDRLREAGVAFVPGASVDTLAELYRATYANGDTNGSVVLLAPEPTADSWTPVNLAELPERPPTQPTLGSVGIVYPGKRHVFSGPPESAKTIAAYLIGLYVVRAGARVVLVDFEMGAYDARSRLRELGASADDLALLSYLEPDEPAAAEKIASLIELAPSLVIIDAAAGAYDLQGLDDNKRADVEKLARLYVTPFWHRGIATLFIDHVVKNVETRGKFTIGSERKLGGADVHLGFETISAISRGGSGLYKIVTHKDRGGYLKRGHLLDLALTSDPETHLIEGRFTSPTPTVTSSGARVEFRPTHLMEKCSAWLELQVGTVSRNAVFDAVGGRKAYVLKAISILVAEGFVEASEGPNRSQFVESKRPYREADPACNPPVVPGGSPVVPGTTWQGGDSSVVPGGSPVVPGTSLAGGSRSLPLPGGEREAPPTDHDRAGAVVPEEPQPVQSSWLDGDLDYLDRIVGGGEAE